MLSKDTFVVEPFAMGRRTAHTNPVSLGLQLQNEAGYALSSGSLLSLQKPRTEEPENEIHN
jgi:hypothetical protein